MRRRMIIVEHPDHNSEKPAYFGHGLLSGSSSLRYSMNLPQSTSASKRQLDLCPTPMLEVLVTAKEKSAIPLPKGWPRRVRSAVIHTISLARASATHTRSWTANHYSARLRLKAENERLRGEVLHLREEVRIKGRPDGADSATAASPLPSHRTACDPRAARSTRLVAGSD